MNRPASSSNLLVSLFFTPLRLIRRSVSYSLVYIIHFFDNPVCPSWPQFGHRPLKDVFPLSGQLRRLCSEELHIGQQGGPLQTSALCPNFQHLWHCLGFGRSSLMGTSRKPMVIFGGSDRDSNVNFAICRVFPVRLDVTGKIVTSDTGRSCPSACCLIK